MIINYNGNSLKSGIYEIKNLLCNARYIGSAKEFKERWRQHIYALKNNKHQNKFLQNTFNKRLQENNTDNFLEFNVVELMEDSTKEQRLNREKFWIEQYRKLGVELYNLNFDPTNEIKVWSTNTEETRKLHSSYRKNKTYEEIFGKTYSNKIKTKQSKAHKKRFENNPELSEIISKNMVGNKNHFYGKSHSKETKEILSKSQIGISIEQKLGCEKAKLFLENQSKRMIEFHKNNPIERNRLGNIIKGKTLEEIYGTEKAKEIKLKKSNSKSKIYKDIKLINKDQTIVYFRIDNLRIFCEENFLLYSSMTRVMLGKIKKHRGWELL